jgi:hypothetical protein
MDRSLVNYWVLAEADVMNAADNVATGMRMCDAIETIKSQPGKSI